MYRGRGDRQMLRAFGNFLLQIGNDRNGNEDGEQEPPRDERPAPGAAHTDEEYYRRSDNSAGARTPLVVSRDDAERPVFVAGAGTPLAESSDRRGVRSSARASTPRRARSASRSARRIKAPFTLWPNTGRVEEPRRGRSPTRRGNTPRRDSHESRTPSRLRNAPWRKKDDRTSCRSKRGGDNRPPGVSRRQFKEHIERTKSSAAAREVSERPSARQARPAKNSVVVADDVGSMLDRSIHAAASSVGKSLSQKVDELCRCLRLDIPTGPHSMLKANEEDWHRITLTGEGIVKVKSITIELYGSSLRTMYHGTSLLKLCSVLRLGKLVGGGPLKDGFIPEAIMARDLLSRALSSSYFGGAVFELAFYGICANYNKERTRRGTDTWRVDHCSTPGHGLHRSDEKAFYLNESSCELVAIIMHGTVVQDLVDLVRRYQGESGR